MATVKYEPGQWGRDQLGVAVVVVTRKEVKDVKGTVHRYWVTDRGIDGPMRLLDLGAFTAEAMPERIHEDDELVAQVVMPAFAGILAETVRRDGR